VSSLAPSSPLPDSGQHTSLACHQLEYDVKYHQKAYQCVLWQPREGVQCEGYIWKGEGSNIKSSDNMQLFQYWRVLPYRNSEGGPWHDKQFQEKVTLPSVQCRPWLLLKSDKVEEGCKPKKREEVW
jgi:hypothetical protein